MTPFYPEIDEKKILQIKSLHKQDPDFLDREECPYSDDFIAMIKWIPRATRDIEEEMEEIDLTDSDVIDGELHGLYQDLKDIKTSALSAKGSSADKNTYFKLSYQLLKDVVELRERNSNVDRVNLFIETVLQTIEQYVDTDQRVLVIDELRKVTGE